MTNYYDILRVSSTASASEIKTAFRVLAKLYHPDINPAGQEEFKKILRAYETLINPSRKSSYDLKLKYHHASLNNPQTTKTKNWTFEEKELKRRQYYNEHIKKHEKAQKTREEHAGLKKNYNEYKYILFATPIAVALFLLVINFASSPKKTLAASETKTEILKMGDEPYRDFFGTGKFEMSNGKSLSIKNGTSSDIIVCIFSENNFVRSSFIKEGFYVEIPQLPSTQLEIRFHSGTNWNSSMRVEGKDVEGMFSQNPKFYKGAGKIILGGLNEITLVPGVNEGFNEISATEFFYKESI